MYLFLRIQFKYLLYYLIHFVRAIVLCVNVFVFFVCVIEYVLLIVCFCWLSSLCWFCVFCIDLSFFDFDVVYGFVCCVCGVFDWLCFVDFVCWLILCSWFCVCFVDFLCWLRVVCGWLVFVAFVLFLNIGLSLLFFCMDFVFCVLFVVCSLCVICVCLPCLRRRVSECHRCRKSMNWRHAMRCLHVHCSLRLMFCFFVVLFFFVLCSLRLV